MVLRVKNLLINTQMRIVCIFSFLYSKRQTTSDTDINAKMRERERERERQRDR